MSIGIGVGSENVNRINQNPINLFCEKSNLKHFTGDINC